MMNSIEQLARYNYSYEGEAIGAAIAIIVIVIFLAIAAILAQIFLGLAVYHDAKSKGNSSSGMWGVLTGVFGWIPAIIYLCVRNSSSQRIIQCTTCGFAIPASAPGCPNCNHANPFAQQFYGPFVEQSKKRAQTARAVPGTAVRRHRSQCCAIEAPFRIRLAVNRPFSA